MSRIIPPDLAGLFQRYLRGQTDAQAHGLGFPEATGEVVPYEAMPVQPIDPRQAWEDALAVTACVPGLPAVKWPVPPDWPALVTGQEPAVALAFCLGNTPQQVRNLHPLLAGDLLAQRAASNRAEAPAALVEWARNQRGYPGALLAAGMLRLAGCFDEAESLLKPAAPEAWRSLRGNEEAALAWHRGRTEEAINSWRRQDATVPVLFNRGMAALFLNDAEAARISLTEAVAGLPETSPWYHLGQLYLALAAGRG